MAVLTKITTRSLADNAVSSAKIQDGAIAVADVADGSISTAKLADDAVTQAKIGAGAVGNTEVNSSAGIVATKLASIPNSKLEDDPLPKPYKVQSKKAKTRKFIKKVTEELPPDYGPLLEDYFPENE